MKVLVTGAGGFIGSHLAERLLELGHDVRAFIRYNSRSNRGFLEANNDIDFFLGDIRDYDSVKGSMSGVDMVFHLAALIGIPYSYDSPLAYVKTNIEGTYNILQAAREAGISRVVHTSTSEVYGTARYVPINEDHPLQAQSPYSATKIAADQLALSYYRSFGLPVVVVRPFNAYGPRQSSRAIIPTIISQVLSDSAQPVRLGNLAPTRDFNFVKDVVEGFIALGFCNQALGEVVNIGTEKDISIGKLVRVIADILETEIRVNEDSARLRPELSEVYRLVCDNTKIRSMTSWEPRYTLIDGLKETIEYIKDMSRLYKPDIYNK